MSTSTASIRRLPERASSPRPNIRVVATRTQRKARPRLAYPLIGLIGVFTILITNLLLSVGVSSGAYEIADLNAQNKELARTYQTLTQDIDRLSSPQNLASNAGVLGMVNNATPVYLRLSDGAVLGAPVRASAAAGVASSSTKVPNSLLTGVPLVTQLEADAAAKKAAAELAAQQGVRGSAAGSTTAGAPASATAAGPVVLSNGIPAVTTH